MGQSSLILTLAATLTIVVILIVVGQTTRDTDSELAEYQYKVLAREAASTGLNMSVRRIVAEPHRWSDTTLAFSYPVTPHGVGSFSTTVTPRGAFVETFYGWMDQDTVDIVSTGRVSTVDGDTTHIIEARYVKGYYDFGLPPAFKKAVFADSVLSINGTAEIRHTDSTQNAHIHGNDEIKAVGTGSGATVQGYGTVSNDPVGVYDQIRPSAEAIFQPNDPQDGTELVGPDFPIYLPPIDASAIHDQAELNGVPHHHVMTTEMDPPKGNETRHTLDLNGVTIRPSDFSCYSSGCGTYDNPMLYYVRQQHCRRGVRAVCGRGRHRISRELDRVRRCRRRLESGSRAARGHTGVGRLDGCSVGRRRQYDDRLLRRGRCDGWRRIQPGWADLCKR